MDSSCEDNPKNSPRLSPSHFLATSDSRSRIDANNSQEMSPSSVPSNLLQSHDQGLSPNQPGLQCSWAKSGFLDNFFDWRHPRLVKDPDHTPSKSTRRPTFHDMHLHEGLRLKKVVIRKGLPEFISSICDRYIDSDNNLIDSLSEPENLKMFPTKKYREKQLDKALPIIDEESLRAEYQATIANFCSIVASTLNFGLKKWDAVFSWTSHSTVRQANGKADGFLSINPDTLSTLTKTQQQDVLLMQKYLLKHFVVWEFKSLTAGSLSVMQGIAEHGGDFVWTVCTSPRGCESHCTAGRISITGRKTGPDATRQLWSDNISNDSDRKRKLENTDGIKLPQPTQAPSNSNGFRLSETSVPNEDLCLSLNQCSHDILQQVWSQTVKNDATYFIINAGNFEYVGIRERETQTMYLSDLLKPSEETGPTQVKLHTAIMMAGYHDTLNRAKQLDNMARSNRLPALYTFNYDRDNHEYPECQQAHSALTKKQKQIQNCENEKVFLSTLHRAESIYFRPPMHITRTTDNALYKLHRKKSEDERCSLDPEPTLQLDAHTKLGGERTRLVLMVNFETSKSCSGKVVVKHAKSEDEKLALQKEYDTYCRLDELKFSFIVQVYGIFTGCLDGILYDFLFMENGGQSLFDRIDAAPQPQMMIDFFKKYSKSLESAKDELHRRGYVHGSMGMSHILVNTDMKKVSFVSLAKCKQIIVQVDETGPPQKKPRKSANGKRRPVKKPSLLQQEVAAKQLKKDSEELDEVLVKYTK